MGIFYQLDEVDAFTTSAIGEPGHRAFYLEIHHADVHINVKCEKQQAAAIAQYLRRVMSDLPAPVANPLPVDSDLAEPVEAAFVLGAIGLGYDRETDRLLVQLEEVVELNENGEPDPEALEDRGHVRLMLQRGQALAFCEHTETVVAAGRPPCRFCGRPLDPGGHACPKMN
jgi:uncharacterized repeat protein (TIGR03847 family)